MNRPCVSCKTRAVNRPRSGSGVEPELPNPRTRLPSVDGLRIARQQSLPGRRLVGATVQMFEGDGASGEGVLRHRPRPGEVIVELHERLLGLLSFQKKAAEERIGKARLLALGKRTLKGPIDAGGGIDRAAAPQFPRFLEKLGRRLLGGGGTARRAGAFPG